MFQDTFNVVIIFLCCAAFVRNKRWMANCIFNEVKKLDNFTS